MLVLTIVILWVLSLIAIIVMMTFIQQQKAINQGLQVKLKNEEIEKDVDELDLTKLVERNNKDRQG